MSLLNHYPFFLLIFARMSAFMITLPLFSYRTIPAFHKAGFSFFLALIMYETMKPPVLEINAFYFQLLLKEIFIGLMIGFLAYLMYSAIMIAGSFMDFQIGFAIANIIDPQTGAQSPLLGQLLNTLALLLMLSLNAHHMLLDGVYYSFQYIPPESVSFSLTSDAIPEFIMKSFSLMFLIAFQMALPIVGSLFIVDIALGIVAKTVPQMNIFVVGLPVKMLSAFLLLMIVMGALFFAMQGLFETLTETMRDLIKLLGGVDHAVNKP
ncbi:flagellar type III secretion system protein FliR [Bacillus sp. FJAT-42376]|uniref:flagellar biosynthetic protein FliR n=1 Tax=Bacillus sp. FJAT-42376 TaxID=2014076 RepID=UPI000F4EF6E6|nr:flagellar biosynthetic protein FliR [Bacillus sp. FJAT-42376]AZB42954.1 flagellar type III secretion system protein FliR [Bacillus sp. FJAT-42376]